VVRALRLMGTHVANWRKLQRLTAAQVAERAGLRDTLRAIEQGKGTASTENCSGYCASSDSRRRGRGGRPYQTDVGRLRADEILPRPGQELNDRCQAQSRRRLSRSPWRFGPRDHRGTLWVHERAGRVRPSVTPMSTWPAQILTTRPNPVEIFCVFQTPADRPMFSAFGDSAPDRWGENLMRRENASVPGN